jgi:putative addiction module component (TIGR02574 family)
MSATEILEQMRRMPDAERRELVQRIEDEFANFSDELTSEQIAELERRAADARAHPERGIPWETVRAELFERYKVKQ